MADKLIFILPVITVLLFVINLFYRGNSVSTVLVFILTLLPLMDLKITLEAQGGFKVFDAICFYAVVFLFKDFITINLSKRHNLFLLLFIILCVVVTLGGISSEFPAKTYLNLVKILPVFIFGRFLLTACINNPGFHFKVIKYLKISYITALVFLAIQVVVGLKFTFYPGLSINTIDPVFHVIRYPGVFFDSQAHGQYLAIGSFLFLFNDKNAGRKELIINYIIFGLAVVGIILAGSRAAFGGFGIGLLIAILFAGRRYRIYGSLLIVASIALYIIVKPEAGMFDRTKNLSDDYLFRKGIWDEAFDISRRHIYLGIGSGNYQSYVMRHNQNQYLEIEDGKLVYFDQPENGYLKIIVELGYIGFFAYLLFIVIPLAKGFYFRIKNIGDNRIVFLIASLTTFLVAFNTVYSIYDYRILIMVVCVIVLISSYPEIYEVADEFIEE